MSARRRLVIIGVAVLSVIAAAVVALTLADGGPDTIGGKSSPSPSASVAPSNAAAASPSVAPTTADEEDTLAILREIEDQVVAIRGLPAAEIGPPELITRAELGDELERILEEEYPPEEQERDNVSLRALGLLEEDQDVADLQLQLLGDQVLGFYDDTQQRMVVVTDAGLDANARLTYAHEYTHALQDAAFDLDTLQTDTPGEDDRGLARTALIEGDAVVSMLAWAFANLSPEELIDIGATPVPSTEGIPSWMVDQLQFPYTDGFNWASVLAGNPTDPDFDQLDAAFDAPPDSTEQIIHIGKWDPRETPESIDELDLAAGMGDGWEEIDATPIGEETIRVMLTFHGLARTVANEAGAGWGGDRAVIATGPNDTFAVSWRTVWDTPADAREFADAYRAIVGSLPFPAEVVEEADGSVLVVHASS